MMAMIALAVGGIVWLVLTGLPIGSVTAAGPAFEAASDSRHFPVTASTPVALHEKSFSVGAFSFSLVDCGTQFLGNQITHRITLVRFGSMETFFNAPMEAVVAVFSLTAFLPVFAVLVCMRWGSNLIVGRRRA